mmetsp:Transcript_33445/g.80864  ORF Transcript_33445/g.80864 Transcript_33445/m.80864 type:complete len:665 (-) Transcript_33445:587-2581(-)
MTATDGPSSNEDKSSDTASSHKHEHKRGRSSSRKADRDGEDDDEVGEISSSKLDSTSSSDSSDDTESEDNEDGDDDNDGDEKDTHMDECFICDDGGDLILCDGEGCNKAYHAECVNVDINTLPLTWYCPSCIDTIEKMAETSLGDNATAPTAMTATMATKSGGSGSVESPGEQGNLVNETDVAISSKSTKAKALTTNTVITIDSSSDTSPGKDMYEKEPPKANGSHGSNPSHPATATPRISNETYCVNETDSPAPKTVNESPANDNETCRKQSEAVEMKVQQHRQASTEGLDAPRSQGSDTFQRQTQRQVNDATFAPNCKDTTKNASDVTYRRQSIPQGSSAFSSGARAISTPSVPPISFRTVMVPDGVVPGEIFHVLFGGGSVMGAVCPRGVRSGDEIIIMEPGCHEPPLTPREIVKINQQHLMGGIDPLVVNAFWAVLWPLLTMEGWTSTRQVYFNFGAMKFFPPGARPVDKSNWILNVDYFDTILDIRIYISKMAKYEKIVQEFDTEIETRKNINRETAAEGNRKKRKARAAIQRVSQLDAWKYVGEREHIRVGSNFQVRSLPRAGTSDTGAGENYIQEKIWDTTGSTPCLTPSDWLGWAKDSNFIIKFHKSIMECRKQMHILASSVDKPVDFCIWYCKKYIAMIDFFFNKAFNPHVIALT